MTLQELLTALAMHGPLRCDPDRYEAHKSEFMGAEVLLESHDGKRYHLDAQSLEWSESLADDEDLNPYTLVLKQGMEWDAGE